MSNKQLCLCVSVCVACLCFSPSSTANCHLVWGNKRQKKNSCRGTFKQPKGIYSFFLFIFSLPLNFWDMDAYSLMSITVVRNAPHCFSFFFFGLFYRCDVSDGIVSAEMTRRKRNVRFFDPTDWWIPLFYFSPSSCCCFISFYLAIHCPDISNNILHSLSLSAGQTGQR